MNLSLPKGTTLTLMKEVPFAGIVCFLILGVIGGCILTQKSYERFGGNRKKVLAAFISIPVVSVILLLFRFGDSMITVKGTILMLLFLYASYSDIRTRKCGDLLHVFVLITALIGVQLFELPEMLIAGLFVIIVMVSTSVVFRGRIGGADIKFAAACGGDAGPNHCCDHQDDDDQLKDERTGACFVCLCHFFFLLTKNSGHDIRHDLNGNTKIHKNTCAGPVTTALHRSDSP